MKLFIIKQHWQFDVCLHKQHVLNCYIENGSCSKMIIAYETTKGNIEKLRYNYTKSMLSNCLIENGGCFKIIFAHVATNGSINRHLDII